MPIRECLKLAAARLLFIFLLGMSVSGCQTNGSSPDVPKDASDAFPAAFQAEALRTVEAALVKDPQDGVQLYYRAACYAMLERHEDAAESFRLGESLAPEGFTDKTVLYLRALSLFHVKTFRRAQFVLDRLAKTFPHSRLSKRGQDLALKIERRLAEGVKETSLNWYLNEGLEAYDSARPALAVEYLEEYFLLTDRLSDGGYREDPQANFSLGGAYVELGESEKAVAFLERVPTGYGGYSGGLMLAMCLHVTGDDERAESLLGEIVSKADNPSVKERAQRLLKAWVLK